MEEEVAEGERVLADFRAFAAGVLGYPKDFTEALTAHEIAELGAGLVSFPSAKRRRLDDRLRLPSIPNETVESAEDEARLLEETPMRGVVQPPKTQPVRTLPPAEPVCTARALHPAERLAAEMPPIGWEFGPIAVLDKPTVAEKRPDLMGVPLDDAPYYVSPLEQEGPEYRTWAARMLATTTEECCVGGVLRTVDRPVVEVSERFDIQNVGSSRIFTRVVRENAAAKAKTRDEIRASGLQTAHFQALGDTATPQSPRKPEWDISNLREFSLPAAQKPHGLGRYAVFVHSEPTPSRRPLQDDPTVFTGFLPASAPSNEDKQVLGACRQALPVDFPVARPNGDGDHPGLSPVRGFELWADSPAGRSFAAINPSTDFLVTASGRIVGQIECTVTLGQTLPKTPNFNDSELRDAAEAAYHNAVLPVFYPDPHGPPANPTLAALLAPWAPFKQILARTRCLGVIAAMATRRADKRYALKGYLGPVFPRALSRRQRMELQAVGDYTESADSTPYLRKTDPRHFGTAVHGYLRGTCFLQVGGRAASSDTTISPLTLSIKAPVAEAKKNGDAVPRKRDGNGVELVRFPKRKTKREEEEEKLQGTHNDQRTFDRAKRIKLAKEALAAGWLTKEEAHKVRVVVAELKANVPQSNERRWWLINTICRRTKTNQGTVRRDGLTHAVDRSQWYTAAVFRALTLGQDGTAVHYPRDVRAVEAGHRIEFCEWTADPSFVRHVSLTVRWPGQPAIMLSSRSGTGWQYNLRPEERVVAIWAVYYRLSIRKKRRVRAEIQSDFRLRDVAGSVKMIDEQIEAIRRQMLGLTGLQLAFLRGLCR